VFCAASKQAIAFASSVALRSWKLALGCANPVVPRTFELDRHTRCLSSSACKNQLPATSHQLQLQIQIQIALEGLPEDLPPGYPNELDFSPIMSQISKLQQQHVMLCLSSWVSLNASWLQDQGFLLDRSWLPDGPRSVVMVYADNDIQTRLFEEAGLPATRHAAVRPLIRQLSEVAFEHQWPLIAEVVCDLNAIKWNPHHARCVLIEALDDIMEDGEAWLDAHYAYRQAASLDGLTPQAPNERARGRL